MSDKCKITPTATNIDPKECKSIALNAYTVTRIVYEVIKTYMLTNSPKQAGVRLEQMYDADYKKSGILLDIGYNWRTKDMSKVPAIFIQREEVTFKTPTMGQNATNRGVGDPETKFAIATMPVTVTCVAAEPLAVVENLAEYVKKPLLYFRNDVQQDYGITRFQLAGISKPKLLEEGKNNFYIDLTVNISYADSWEVKKDALKIKHIGIELFDQIWQPLATLDV